MEADPKRVLVFLAEGAEEMEVTILVDVLRRADLDVVLAGLTGEAPVTCSRGVRLLPDCALASVEGEFDMLVLPGGLGGTRELAASSEVGELLRRHHAADRPIAAICAAPMALAKHEICAGLAMTCHPSVRDIVGSHGELTDGEVVETRELITSQGPGTAFAFALAIVQRLVGEDVASSLRGPMMLR